MFLALAGSAALAESTVTGAGYSNPVPIYAAPGQVITLFVQGVGRNGLSVTFRQAADFAAPILDVRTLPATCDIVGGCGTLTAITVQTPAEIAPICPLCGVVQIPVSVFVSENGSASAATSVIPLADQIHVLSMCDTIVPNAIVRMNTSGLPCPPVVTHTDGSLVNAAHPAKPGEAPSS